MNDKQFGQWIRKTRKEHGMTQRDLSEILWIGQSHMSMVEQGYRGLGAEYDEKLAEAFQITVSDVQDMRNLAGLSEVRVETSNNFGVILNGDGTYILVEDRFGNIDKIRIHEEDRSKLREILTG